MNDKVSHNHKRVLVVYYSLEGHCRQLADYMADYFGYDTLALEPKKDFDPQGNAKHVVGRMQILFNQHVALKDLPERMEGYDLVIIGTPVWSGKCAPAIHTFLHALQDHMIDIGNVPVALYATYDKDCGQVFNSIKAMMNQRRVVGEISFNIVDMSWSVMTSRLDNWLFTLSDSY